MTTDNILNLYLTDIQKKTVYNRKELVQTYDRFSRGTKIIDVYIKDTQSHLPPDY